MALDRLLAPSSIAIVGASERPSIGRTIVRSLGVLGYSGRVLPVHPRHETIQGHPCSRDIREIDGDIDVVAICLSRERVVPEVEKAVARGVGGIVVYAGGFAETGDQGSIDQERIIEICRAGGVELCGPNCMGVMSLHNRSSVFMMDVLDPERLTGNVGVVSQSGSICIGLLYDTRRYGYSHVISTGNEAVTTTAQYIEYLVDDPDTAVIALFAETVRAPDRFVAALDRAFDAGKPVVIVRAGRSARAAAAIQTHTGGLAGGSRALSAVLQAHRAIEVANLEELTEVVSACQGRRWPAGGRLAVVTGSGGHAELMLDLAHDAGLDLPPLPEGARRTIEAKVGPITGDGNPIDVWGQSDFAGNFTLAIREASTCGAYDAVVVSLDGNDNQPVDYEGQDEVMNRVLVEAHAEAALPLYLMSTRHGVHKTVQVSQLRGEGIASVGGMAQGLGAITRLAEWKGARRRCPERVPLSAGVPEWAFRTTVHELDAKRLLRQAGLTVTRSLIVADAVEAVEAARELGYPVVMKGVGDALPHRSDHGLVELALKQDGAVRTAFERFRQRLEAMPSQEAAIVIQEMAPPGVEVIAGIARDPSFGLMMAAGPGGVLAELFDEVLMCPVPATDDELAALTRGRRLHSMLAGWRGSGEADRVALIAALRGLSDFAAAHEPWIGGIDINPLIVHPTGEGCTVADALIVPREGRCTTPA